MDRTSITSLLSHVSETTISEHEQDVDIEQSTNFNTKHNPGDIIVTCKPFVHIIADWMKGRICDLCLRSDSYRDLRCCNDCEQLYFCSSCLRSKTPSVFKTLHMLECSLFAKYGNILSGSSKLFLRLYLRLNNPESLPYRPYLNPITKEEITFNSLVPRIIFNDSVDETDEFCELVKSMYERLSLKEQFEDEEENELTVEQAAVLQFIDLLEEIRLCEELLPLISDDLKIFHLWTIFDRLWSYTIPIVDESITGLFNNDAIAYSLYLEPNVIIYSHSCLPNCSFAHYGPILQLRAMKPIYSGQNLTVNYININQSKTNRVKQLQSFLISDCFCTRCLDNSSVDYVQFNIIKKEFVDLYIEELMTPLASQLNKSVSFLNFSSMSISDDEQLYSYQNCVKLHNLAYKLNEIYDRIYPFNHPDKSRFLFAYTAVEMNLLLYKLEAKENIKVDEEELKAVPNNKISCESDCSEFTSKHSHNSLNSLVDDINQWSELLKRTVRAIRWTHGTDHPLFRKLTLPLLKIWKLSRPTITLCELHSDPSVLLKILIHSSDQSKGLLQQLDELRKHFSMLIPTKSTIESDRSIGSHLFFYFVKTFLRAMLILFAVFFPLYIYFTIYEEEL